MHFGVESAYLYAHLGFLTIKALQIGLIVAFAAILSANVMKVILPKISSNLFNRIGYGAMVLSGVLMLKSSIIGLQIAHNPDIKLQYLAKGLDASLSWNSLLYSLEFKYTEGFEFEKVVPLASLSNQQKSFVYSQQALFAKVVIEKVLTLTTQSYEAYFYDEKGHLIKKVKFS